MGDALTVSDFVCHFSSYVRKEWVRRLTFPAGFKAVPLASPTTLDPVLRRTFSSRIPMTLYIYRKGAPVVTMYLVGSFSKISTLQGDIPKGFSVKATQFPSRFTKSRPDRKVLIPGE